MRTPAAAGKAAESALRGSGGKPRHGGGISPRLFYGTFVVLLASNVFTLVALLMAPDIAVLLSDRNDQVLAAYEDRVAQLRTEVDRLHSRQYAQAGNLNLQLQELSHQQEILLEQHQYVRLLADKAAELGIETAALPAEEESSPGFLVGDAAAIAAGRLDAVTAQMRQMMSESRLALAALTASATESTEAIVAELRKIGLEPRLPTAGAVGGPLLPPDEGPEEPSLIHDANSVMAALTRYKAARAAIMPAPVHRPIAESARRSSNFGNRRDPFTRARAFHAGIDFAAPTGTTVFSAGAGEVIFAGRMSGYGNVVEVSHGNGLVSRYAHLSAFLVKEGQRVESGTPIARVGSTGRSTGPHLHFEMRRKDVAVDPGTFLAAGNRLRRFLGS